MRMVLLFPLLWVVLVASAHAEADSNSTAKSVDTTPAEIPRIVPSVRKWYVGSAFGLNYLIGWNPNAIDGYYRSLGYTRTYESSYEFEYSLMKTGAELGAYGGYRMTDFLDAELGVFSNVNDWYYRWVYEDTKNVNPKRQMSQRISAKAVYLAALIRPFDHGYQQGVYLKVGRHYSELFSATTNNGSLIDINAAGAGGAIPNNGTTRGRGNLLGIGMDIKLPKKIGAIRVEFNKYYNLGGTRFDKVAWIVGYNTGF